MLLENEEVFFKFSATGGLSELVDKHAYQDLVCAAAANREMEQPLWSLQFVDAVGATIVHSTHVKDVDLKLSTDFKANTKTLYITYKDVPIGIENYGLVSVTLQVDLADGACATGQLVTINESH